MLVWNIDTADYLTNGQTGTLEDIIQDDSGSVRHLMIRFNRESAGRQARAKHPQLAVSHPGCTRIDRHMNTYSLSKKGSGATATVIQFPIRLAHAVTAHKTQGLTIHQPNTVNLDLMSIFEPAQGYVMLGRAQALEQVFIQDKLNPDQIFAAPRPEQNHQDSCTQCGSTPPSHGRSLGRPNTSQGRPNPPVRDMGEAR